MFFVLQTPISLFSLDFTLMQPIDFVRGTERLLFLGVILNILQNSFVQTDSKTINSVAIEN